MIKRSGKKQVDHQPLMGCMRLGQAESVCLQLASPYRRLALSRNSRVVPVLVHPGSLVAHSSLVVTLKPPSRISGRTRTSLLYINGPVGYI